MLVSAHDDRAGGEHERSVEPPVGRQGLGSRRGEDRLAGRDQIVDVAGGPVRLPELLLGAAERQEAEDNEKDDGRWTIDD